MTISLASAYRMIGEADLAQECAMEALNIGVDPTDIQFMLAGVASLCGSYSNPSLWLMHDPPFPPSETHLDLGGAFLA